MNSATKVETIDRQSDLSIGRALEETHFTRSAARSTMFRFAVSRAQIVALERDGNDLVIAFVNGAAQAPTEQ